nr:MAG TPA: hypothetical protein [Caudoviricetes sp.]
MLAWSASAGVNSTNSHKPLIEQYTIQRIYGSATM